MELYEISRKSHRMAYEKTILQFTTKLMREKTGKGPNNIRVKILEDIIDIHMEGFLTDIEKSILENPEHFPVIQILRQKLYEMYKKEFLEQVSKILGSEVDVLHTSKDFLQDKSKITLIMK